MIGIEILALLDRRQAVSMAQIVGYHGTHIVAARKCALVHSKENYIVEVETACFENAHYLQAA